MSGPTSPRIFVAQNTEDAQRKVAAQARLYSDAKAWLNARLALIAALALVSAVAALFAANEARTITGAGGGVLLLIFSFVGANIEKRKRLLAVAVQEDFDTGVFRLRWNSIELNRPSPLVVAKAAARYDGGREKNWYGDTRGTHRPFDVLICQSTRIRLRTRASLRGQIWVVVDSPETRGRLPPARWEDSQSSGLVRSVGTTGFEPATP
jgi:hypothetical protein